jgi:hypothetical protein
LRLTCLNGGLASWRSLTSNMYSSDIRFKMRSNQDTIHIRTVLEM